MLAHLAGPALPALPWQDLVELLDHRAREDAGQVWLEFLARRGDGQTYTFGEVQQGALKMASLLRQHGASGGRVVLALPNGAAFVHAFFGALYVGAAAVPYPVPAGKSPEMLATRQDILIRMVRDCGARHIVARQADHAVMAPIAEACGAALVDPADAAELTPCEGYGAGETALVQYTSAPVREPHGVVLSHRAILNNAWAIGQAIGQRPGDAALSWLPLYQDMGLVGMMLTSLIYRYPLALMSPDAFLLRPSDWTRIIASRRITISAAPNFGYAMCARRLRDKHLDGLDLSHWRIAINGAEALQARSVNAFEAKLAPYGGRRGLVVPAYGLAENGLVATIGDLGQPLTQRAGPDRRLAVSSGRPMTGQEVAIVNTGGSIVDQNVQGEIIVRSASLMQGYVGRTEATSQALRNGWLHTGDLGFIGDGQLFVTGRLKRMIIKRGKNCYAQDVEQVVQDAMSGICFEVVASAEPNERDGTEDLIVRAVVNAPEADLPALAKRASAAVLGTLGVQPTRMELVPGT